MDEIAIIPVRSPQETVGGCAFVRLLSFDGMHKQLCALTPFLFAAACAGCDSHAYWAEAMQYSAIAHDTLIENGTCTSIQDCQRRDLLFAEGGEVNFGFVRWGGAYINLYETQDAALVQQLEAKFKELHARLGKPNVTLTVYSSKHLEPKVTFREVVIK